MNLQSHLVQELSQLRKGEGILPHKLRNTPTIRDLAARATHTSVDTLTDNQAYTFLVSELLSQGDGAKVEVLKNALGINSPHKKLSLRRSAIAATFAKHTDTIERYENQGINEFAAHLAERALRPQTKTLQQSSPVYIQNIEAQARATRSMTTIGLSSHLSLGAYGDELIKYLEMPRKPYINASVNITLLSSSRGSEWYRFRLSYVFQGARESFRVAVVLNSADGELLMANGLVDDYHRLDNPDNPTRDIKTIIASSKFLIRNSHIHAQKLIRFRALEPTQASRILASTSKPLLDSCWLLEITIPPQWQSEDCTYEYLSWIHLQIASVAYWYSPTLMYLKKLTLDFSQFPGANTRDFFLLPFLGHTPGIELTEKNLYILNLNNWIMPGHGIVLGWQS